MNATSEAIAMPAGASPTRPLSVLVVEDDAEVRHEIIDFLSADGCRALGAPNGAVALEALRKAAPVDIVLLDLWMPIMDGWTFRIHQRQDPILSEVPVIVLTADDAPQARAIDADEVVKKPFDIEALGRKMRSVVAARRSTSGTGRDLVAKALELVVGAVGHEVANPLTALIWSLETERAAKGEGASGQLSSESIEELLGHCWRISDTLRALRGLPYPLCRAESRVDLVQVLRSVIASATTPPSSLTFASESDLFVRADPLVVRYALTTALEHATETAAGPERSTAPHVEVRAFREGDHAVVQVDDRGPPIPGHVEHVFSLEYTGRVRAWSAGLRLWYVRRAMLEMGGAIEIANRAPVGVSCRLVFRS